ncbi:MAG: HD domain-containing protein, partial [Sulfurimonas sp.]
MDIEKIKEIDNVDSATECLFEQMPKSDALQKALEYSKSAHEEQFRKSGQPYVVHPILVAAIVSSITNDEAMAIAALLHDIVEDTHVNIDEIKAFFGDDVAHL